MISEYIASAIFLVYFLYKSLWIAKGFFVDSSEVDKNRSIGKAYGKEIFLMLGLCLLVLWLGEKFNF